ncbi:MAG: LUD domain-containing protein [Collinsella sp.]
MEDVKRGPHAAPPPRAHHQETRDSATWTGHYRAYRRRGGRARSADLVRTGSKASPGAEACSFSESGIKAALEADGHRMIDRSQATTPEEQDAMWREQVDADWFFMGTNAITLDGELVNIDGNANRLALLLHGPEHVCVICRHEQGRGGCRKRLKRIRTVTLPAQRRAPTHGHPVRTRPASARTATPRTACAARRSSPATRATHGRIHVILVGEDLGF